MMPPVQPPTPPDEATPAPTPEDGDTRQLIAHTWSETDRFVPSKVVRPIQNLMQVEISSAVAILLATVAALVIANTSWFEAYEHFWESELTIDLGDLHVLEL